MSGVCPSCFNPASLEPHCSERRTLPSPTCDLIRCKACGSYGTRDGRRWFDNTQEKT